MPLLPIPLPNNFDPTSLIIPFLNVPVSEIVEISGTRKFIQKIINSFVFTSGLFFVRIGEAYSIAQITNIITTLVG